MAQNKPPKIRRKYDSSFKTEVIQMIANGRSVPELARSLNIGENIIYRWRQQALGPASPLQTSVSEATGVSLSEHLALQKRLRELEQERDILKKPWASSPGLCERALWFHQIVPKFLSGDDALQGHAGEPFGLLSMAGGQND